MNRPPTVIALACAALVVLSGFAVATAGGAVTTTGASPDGADALDGHVADQGTQSEAGARAGLAGIEQIEESIDPDDVLLAVDVEADGDAVWTVEYRTRLDSEDEEDAFEDLQADVEADPDAYTESFRERMEATADDASAATGREMAVSEMTIATDRVEIPREYGIVTYTFRWSNFAAVDGDRLVVGDAIDGLFLDDASELRIAWADDRALVEATPEPTETRGTAVIWRGPTTFSTGEPRVTLDPATAADDSDGAADPGTDVPEDAASDDVLSATTLAVVGVLLLLVAGGYAVATGRIRLPGRSDAGVTASDDETEPVDASEAVGDAEAGDGVGDAGAEAGADGVGATAGVDTEDPNDSDEEESAADGDESGSDGPGDPFAGVDRELLSNEEQVMRLIEARGGRMKQKRVAEELDWTAAKTSQVTKGLRDEGDLVGFRIGRENVLTLPEEDPR